MSGRLGFRKKERKEGKTGENHDTHRINAMEELK